MKNWNRLGTIVGCCVVLIVALVTSARAQQGPYRIYLPLIESQPQPIIIVDPSPSPSPSALPSPSPSPSAQPLPANTVVVKSYRTFRQSTYQTVVGELVNTRTTPVFFAQIEAKFYDASNQLMAVEDTYAYMTKTDPNQTNPFKIMLSNAPTTIARVDLTVRWQTTSYLNYQWVAILSQNVRNNYGVEIFGEVQNPHPREMRGIEMAATFYDASGNVLDVDFGFPTATTLAPGATSAYKISTFDESSYSSVLVQAQGYIAP